MNSDRFLHRESIVYARATFAGSRVFQASSAWRTFCIALSRVNGGKGGRAGVVSVSIIFFSFDCFFPHTHKLTYSCRDLVFTSSPFSPPSGPIVCTPPIPPP